MLRNTVLLCAAFLLAQISHLSAQNFKVQVGAFAEPVGLDYFKDRGIDQVYESVDQLGIFHYFVGAYKTREEAEEIENQLKIKGFRGAGIFDMEAQRALCGTPCPYFADSRIYFDENSQVLALKSVFFDYDKSSVGQDGIETLKAVFQILKENPKAKVTIYGYTDAQGSPKYNVELATRRARAARNELIMLGIHSDRMNLKVFGELDPARPNADDHGKDSPEGRRMNRRVVIAIMLPSGEIQTEFNDNVEGKPVKKH